MDKLSKIEAKLANIEKYLIQLNEYIDGLSDILVRTQVKLEQLKLVEPEELEEPEWWQ